MTTQLPERESLQSWRRRVLLAALGTGAWLPRVVSANSAPTTISESVRATLVAVLDQLIPPDEVTPSASALGVDREILRTAQDTPLYLRLITQSCIWLDEQTTTPFHQLPDASATKLLQWTETLPPDSFPRRFLEIVRNDAMALYYAKPLALQGMPVNRPPQPDGYLLD